MSREHSFVFSERSKDLEEEKTKENQDEVANDVYTEEIVFRKLTQLLRGIPPPPSLTTCKMSCTEMLERIKQNSHLLSLPINPTPLLEANPKVNYLNNGKLSEDIADLTVKLQERYVHSETASTFTTYDGERPLTESARKRRQCKGISPGRRLSHLARRRQMFSRANLQLLSQNEQKKKLAIKTVVNTQRNLAKEYLDYKQAASKVGNIPKRALFQSPEEEPVRPGFRTVAKPVPRRRLFGNIDKQPVQELPIGGGSYDVSGWLASQPFHGGRKRGREESRDSDRKRKCPRRSLDFSDSSPSHCSELSNRSINTPPAPTLTHLNKQKLLWAVAVALKEKNITQRDSIFKPCATTLFNTCRKNLAAIHALQGPEGTSEKMLTYARGQVGTVIESLQNGTSNQQQNRQPTAALLDVSLSTLNQITDKVEKVAVGKENTPKRKVQNRVWRSCSKSVKRSRQNLCRSNSWDNLHKELNVIITKDWLKNLEFPKINCPGKRKHPELSLEESTNISNQQSSPNLNVEVMNSKSEVQEFEKFNNFVVSVTPEKVESIIDYVPASQEEKEIKAFPALMKQLSTTADRVPSPDIFGSPEAFHSTSPLNIEKSFALPHCNLPVEVTANEFSIVLPTANVISVPQSLSKDCIDSHTKSNVSEIETSSISEIVAEFPTYVDPVEPTLSEGFGKTDTEAHENNYLSNSPLKGSANTLSEVNEEDNMQLTNQYTTIEDLNKVCYVEVTNKEKEMLQVQIENENSNFLKEYKTIIDKREGVFEMAQPRELSLGIENEKNSTRNLNECCNSPIIDADDGMFGEETKLNIFETPDLLKERTLPQDCHNEGLIFHEDISMVAINGDETVNNDSLFAHLHNLTRIENAEESLVGVTDTDSSEDEVCTSTPLIPKKLRMKSRPAWRIESGPGLKIRVRLSKEWDIVGSDSGEQNSTEEGTDNNYLNFSDGVPPGIDLNEAPVNTQIENSFLKKISNVESSGTSMESYTLMEIKTRLAIEQTLRGEDSELSFFNSDASEEFSASSISMDGSVISQKSDHSKNATVCDNNEETKTFQLSQDVIIPCFKNPSSVYPKCENNKISLVEIENKANSESEPFERQLPEDLEEDLPLSQLIGNSKNSDVLSDKLDLSVNKDLRCSCNFKPSNSQDNSLIVSSQDEEAIGFEVCEEKIPLSRLVKITKSNDVFEDIDEVKVNKAAEEIRYFKEIAGLKSVNECVIKEGSQESCFGLDNRVTGSEKCLNVVMSHDNSADLSHSLESRRAGNLSEGAQKVPEIMKTPEECRNEPSPKSKHKLSLESYKARKRLDMKADENEETESVTEEQPKKIYNIRLKKKDKKTRKYRHRREVPDDTDESYEHEENTEEFFKEKAQTLVNAFTTISCVVEQEMKLAMAGIPDEQERTRKLDKLNKVQTMSKNILKNFFDQTSGAIFSSDYLKLLE